MGLNPAHSVRSPVVVDVDRRLVARLLREEREIEEARLEAMVPALEQLLRDRRSKSTPP